MSIAPISRAPGACASSQAIAPVRRRVCARHALPIALAMSCGLLVATTFAPAAFALEAKAGGSDGAYVIDGVKVYIDPKSFDSTRYMSAPPSGLEEQEERRIVERWQALRSQQMADRSLSDSKQSIFVFADVVGADFQPERFPLAAKFFESVYKTESNLNKQGKERWARMRPPASIPDLKPVGKFENEGSYPSGHATFGWLAGIVLADMLPEKREAIMNRAREYGLNRVIGGVHFPSDIEAGRILAVACAVEMRHNKAFLADFAAARAEVRKGLRLPD